MSETVSPTPPPRKGLFGTKKESSNQDICERFVYDVLKEQRRARYWSNFFKILAFIYLFLLLYLMVREMPEFKLDKTVGGNKHTAVVKIEGVIASDAEANAGNIIKGLRNAFEDKKTAGVILRINSPGGSPVQSGYVNDEITRLREKYPETPLYAVITDICASGGYYIAAAADKIYANKASIVGSIGVLMNGFGFVGTMEKLGVERRLLTAGSSKGMLDPFSPLKEEDISHIQTLLDSIHKQFIETVKKGRGERLVSEPALFSGLVWTGEQALENGLVDELGSSAYVARDVIKAETMVDFTPKKDYLERFAERLGGTVAKTLAGQMQMQGGALR